MESILVDFHHPNRGSVSSRFGRLQAVSSRFGRLQAVSSRFGRPQAPIWGDESPPRSTPPSSPSPPGTSTAAVWDHEHAVKNRLVCPTQKNYSEHSRTVSMHDSFIRSFSSHARVGERVRDPLHACMGTGTCDEKIMHGDHARMLGIIFLRLTHQSASTETEMLN